MISALNFFNPWWQTKTVPLELTGRYREIFQTLEKALYDRQMTVISGLRRVGKTTLIYQLIDQLIQKQNANPYHALYYSFDEKRWELPEILAEYSAKILQKDLREADRIYLFLDEIQKLPDWADKVKMIYDLYPRIKIVISGSANIMLRKGSRESLAGRFFDYQIRPLDFAENLKFRGLSVDWRREDLFRGPLIVEFNKFLQSGGFIEALNFSETQQTKYFKESLLEQVVYRDIPQVFSINMPDLLLRLLLIISEHPGLYLDYKNLGNDLKYDIRTITNYVEYLDYSLLVQKLYNFSANLLTSEKKLKRIYLSNTAFTKALHPRVPVEVLLEQFWINQLEAKYFFRSPRKEEVDLIFHHNKQILPVEIKIRKQVTKKEAAGLFVFMRKFRLNRGLMITLDTDGEIEHHQLKVILLPYWKYNSVMKTIESFKVS